MDWKNLLVLLAFTINFFLSLLIYFRSKKTTANIMFVITAFGITMWCLAMVFYRASDSSNVIFWTKLLYFFPTFIPTAFLLFGFYYPTYKVKLPILLSIIGMNVIMAFLTLYSGAVIESVNIIEGQEKVIKFGWAYYTLYNIYITGFFIASYYILFKKYLKEGPYVRMQILYILTGMTLASIPAMITNLILPTLNYFEVNWVGQLFTIYWIGGVAYAIIKHRLMEIRLVVARTVAYALLISILAALYTVGLFLAGNLLFSNLTTTNEQLLISTVLALFMAFTFQPLRIELEKLTDAIFFKGYYDPQKLLKSLSTIMSTTIELHTLTLSILDEVIKEIRTTRGTFVLLEKNATHDIEYIEYKGYDHVPVFLKSEVDQFVTNEKIIIFDDLPEGNTKQLMRKLNVSVALPLIVNNEKIGVLFLGEKASGDMYSQQDINLFEILAPELSVAIQNSKEYEEIKRFNITLKDEIDKATKELQLVNEQLKQLDKLKDEFVSLASHELRTPMTAIKSYLWMTLAGKGGELAEKQKYYLDRAYKSTDRLIKLVNDMLNVSRIESGRITLFLQAVKLDKLLSDVVAEVTPRAQELGVSLIFTPLTSLPDVEADPDKIREVLINLIGNSLKFTPQGGSITVTLSPQNDMVETKIADTGAGIKKEDLPKLFQKFATLKESYLVKQNAQGTGLGLYISKALIDLHGGKIWVESEGEGKGATFYFTLKIFKQ